MPDPVPSLLKGALDLLILRTLELGIQDFGVRLASGASASGILRLVVREGLVLTAIGATIGLAGAVAVTRTLGDRCMALRRSMAPPLRALSRWL